MPRLSKIGAAALAAFGWTGLSSVTATYLQVAGGGGSASADAGSLPPSGGGGGGYLTGTTTLNPTLSYTVIVGAGGAGGVNASAGASGNQGSNSQFGTLTASVGGGAGVYGNGVAGGAGGSGGGGSYGGAGGSATSGQGFAGGTGSTTLDCRGSGGGGGAGAVGGNGSATGGGAGGNGLANSITGTSTYYAGGGGGSGLYRGSGFTVPSGATGGLGGGGAGGNGTTTANGVNGTANTGGGGGAPVDIASFSNGGNGGSGVVIISYPSPQKFGGGIVTTSGSNVIHTFTTSGTLSPLSSLTASYLIVAGGGGGGTGQSSSTIGGGGGGGAGGYQAGSGLTIDTNSTYVVTVGAGGSGGVANSSSSTSGTKSSFSIYATASVGGGAGGNYSGFNSNSGGSGGGGDYGSPPGAAGTAGQGNAGGNAYSPGAYYGNGGGGGAGGAGTSATSNTVAPGGVGLANSISGTSTYYAGGGGGGSGQTAGGSAAGGNGGGGAGGYGTVAGTAATANLGGGGGGGGNQGIGGTASSNGGNGGSGIVIISYAGSTQLMAGGTVTISGGNVIHTFTSSGYLTPLKLVNNSLRFRSSATGYLSRTPTTAGNTQKWTWSAWIKRGQLSTAQFLFGGGSAGSDRTFMFFDDTNADTFNLNSIASNISTMQFVTSQVFRDPAAWYHFVVAVDTTQATSTNRVKIYVNGNQITAFSTANYPAQNLSTFINSATSHAIASRSYTGGTTFDGEMTEVQIIDGQQLTPNSFGTFNSYGVWQPITYGGSYGTNGFYLPFTGTNSYYGSFNGSSQYLSWTGNMAGLQFGTGDFTLEAWVNKSGNGTNGYDGLMQYGSGSGGADGWYFEVSASRGIYLVIGNTTPVTNSTAWTNDGYWHHVAVVRASGVVTIYKDGVAVVTGSLTTSVPTSGAVGRIGESFNGSTNYYFNGAISNARIVKGTAIYTGNFTPSTAPLTAVSGTQMLTCQSSTFIDNSSNATSLTNNGTATISAANPFSIQNNIARDNGPAGNNWTANNIGVLAGSTNDNMTDVPTLTSATQANYCVLNPLSLPTAATTTLSNGNLQLTTNTGTTYNSYAIGTMYPTSGKYYAEMQFVSGGRAFLGISRFTNAADPNSWNASSTYYVYSGPIQNNGSTVTTAATYTYGDIIGVAFDADNLTCAFYKNNALQYTVTGLTAGSYTFSMNGYLSGVMVANFGQQPFVYTPPSGFVALNTYNL